MQEWMYRAIADAELIETDAYVAGMIAVFLRNQNAIDKAENRMTGVRLRDFQRGVTAADSRFGVKGMREYHAA